MGKYKLTNRATRDLSIIWNYTFDNWSENQADKYYAELLIEFERISNDQQIGRNYAGVAKSLFGHRINKHIIFYRIVDAELVEITRILHERMDLKMHFKIKNPT